MIPPKECGWVERHTISPGWAIRETCRDEAVRTPVCLFCNQTPPNVDACLEHTQEWIRQHAEEFSDGRGGHLPP